MNFQKFDMANVLANGSHLMASEGKEYDPDDESGGITYFILSYFCYYIFMFKCLII